MKSGHLNCTLAAALVLVAAAAGRAQDTRAGELARRQQEKADQLQRPEPTRAERVLDRIEDLLVDPPRVYPFFGSVYPGGLLAAGVGYRQPLGDTASLDGHAAWSLRNYKVAALRYRLPALLDRRVAVTLDGEWLDAPSVAYYGLGNDSDEEARHTFGYRPETLGAGVTFRAAPALDLGGGLAWVRARSRAGASDPALDDGFGAAELSGFGETLRFTRTSARASLDWRDAPGYSRRGGVYRAEWARYDAARGQPYSFSRLDAEAAQFIPILRGNWVILLRGLASVTGTEPGHAVPFYLLPDLGGSGELPGYPSWRFRDRHRLLLAGEYRWTPSHFVDVAIFHQAGKVAAARRDLDLRQLRRSTGIGLRFHTPATTVMRIELARTDEGLGLVFGFSQGF